MEETAKPPAQNLAVGADLTAATQEGPEAAVSGAANGFDVVEEAEINQLGMKGDVPDAVLVLGLQNFEMRDGFRDDVIHSELADLVEPSAGVQGKERDPNAGVVAPSSSTRSDAEDALRGEDLGEFRLGERAALGFGGEAFLGRKAFVVESGKRVFLQQFIFDGNREYSTDEGPLFLQGFGTVAALIALVTQPIRHVGAGQCGGGGFGQETGQRLDQALELSVGAGLARAILAPVVEQFLPTETRITRGGGGSRGNRLPDGWQGHIFGRQLGLHQTAGLALGEDVVAFLEGWKDVQDQLALFCRGYRQLIPLAHQQGANDGQERLGLPPRQGLGNLGLYFLDVLLEFLVFLVVDPLPAPSEIRFQAGKPQGPQAGD